tara:strand:- start:140 stop:379 length:240 start_codon:yes stop_codon:yes gene_type:complete
MELVEEYTRVIKIEEGYPYAKTLYLPTGKIDAVVDWCKQELSPGWKWQILTSSSTDKPGVYAFFFLEDFDFFAFLLKYG